MDEVGREPGNWELYRGIQRVELLVQSIAANTVSAQVFAIEKAAADDIHQMQGTRLAALEKQREDDRKAIEDQRSKNRLMLYGLIGSPVAAAIVVFITQGGLVR